MTVTEMLDMKIFAPFVESVTRSGFRLHSRLPLFIIGLGIGVAHGQLPSLPTLPVLPVLEVDVPSTRGVSPLIPIPDDEPEMEDAILMPLDPNDPGGPPVEDPCEGMDPCIVKLSPTSTPLGLISDARALEIIGSVSDRNADGIRLKRLGGERYVVSAPGSEIELRFPAAAGEIQPLESVNPTPSVFVPPSFFSVPLPVGSGARAFGIGAFTAVADDATAASWNPAGLTILERPEISAVYRFASTKWDYRGGDDSLKPRNVRVQSDGLNFGSVVVPFQVVNWPVVLSLSSFEAFDSRGRFSATTRDSRSERFEDSRTDRFTATSGEQRIFEDGRVRLNLLASAELTINQRLRQEIEQSLMGTVEFEQEGVIEAIAPAAAVRVTPGLSLGASLKRFQDAAIGPRLRNKTSVGATVETRSTIRRDIERVINGTSQVDGELVIPIAGPEGVARIPILPSVAQIPEVRESSSESSEIVRITETRFEETETLSDLEGMTPTFGVLWDMASWLSLGASLEPGWTAKAKQRRIRETDVVTRDPSGRIVSSQSDRSVESERVEIDFPLRWSAGAAIRFSPDWLLSMDVGQRHYSDFASRGEDGVDRNPFTGTALTEDPLDDTWRAAVGLETLIPFGRRFIPIRAGYQWEEMPAIGAPDEFHAVSVGTGLVGDRTVLDFSYQRRWGDDVMTQVPSRRDVSADVTQEFIACSLLIYF